MRTWRAVRFGKHVRALELWPSLWRGLWRSAVARIRLLLITLADSQSVMTMCDFFSSPLSPSLPLSLPLFLSLSVTLSAHLSVSFTQTTRPVGDDDEDGTITFSGTSAPFDDEGAVRCVRETERQRLRQGQGQGQRQRHTDQRREQ